MALPQNTNTEKPGLENWDIRSKDIQEEEKSKQEQITQEFKNSPEYTIIEQSLSEADDVSNIMNAIATNYGKTGDLKTALENTLKSPESQKRLWLIFTQEEAQKIVDDLLFIIKHKLKNDSEQEKEGDTNIEWNLEESREWENQIASEDVDEKDTSEDNWIGEDTLENEEWDVPWWETDEESEPVNQQQESIITLWEEAPENQEVAANASSDETPWFPTLSRLEQNGVISTEQLENISMEVETGTDINHAIENTITDSGIQETVLWTLNNQKTPEERADNFFKNMPEEAKQWQDPIIDLIAENYREIPGKNGQEPNKNADFITAAQEAVNQVVDGKQFPRNDVFEKNMAKIQAGESKESVYLGLKAVHTYVNSISGKYAKASKKKLDTGKSSVQEKKLLIAKIISQGRQKAEESQSAQQKKIEQVKAAEAQEDWTPEVWELDMLGGWDLDIFVSRAESTKKQA